MSECEFLFHLEFVLQNKFDIFQHLRKKQSYSAFRLLGTVLYKVVKVYIVFISYGIVNILAYTFF